MTQQTNITFEDELWYSDEFQKLKRERKLSKRINSLLKSSIGVKSTEIPTTNETIEEALRDLAAKKALIMERKQIIEKEQEERKAREEESRRRLDYFAGNR